MLIWFFFCLLKVFTPDLKLYFGVAPSVPPLLRKTSALIYGQWSLALPPIVGWHFLTTSLGVTLEQDTSWRKKIEQENRLTGLQEFFSRFMSFALSFKWYNWKDNGKEETTELKKTCEMKQFCKPHMDKSDASFEIVNY